MTGLEERALLAEHLATCARLHLGFRSICEEAETLLPIDEDRIDTLEIAQENVILAFLKRFEQYEDALNRTLRTIAQVMALGKAERLTPVDVARRAEALGIIDSAERWSEAVRARNALAHEYPLRADKRVRQVNRAWDARAVIEELWSGIQQFVPAEGLIDPEEGEVS